jgi:glutathione S-transferase
VFKHHLDRYKYPSRYELTDGLSDRNAAAALLYGLNESLTASTFLSGEQWGLADAAIAPFVRQFAHVDKTWFDAQAWQALHAWLVQFEQSDAYLQCMHKYKVWHPDHKPLAYPHVSVSTQK